MVSVVCSGILLWISFLCFSACPCFSVTRRGILSLHWVIINFVVSQKDIFTPSWDASGLLLPIATLLLLAEHSLTINQPESDLSVQEQIFYVLFLFSTDVLCFLFITAPRIELILCLSISLLYVAIFAHFYKGKEPYQMSTEERVALSSSDLFADVRDPFNCLGSRGGLHFAAIFLSLVLQLTNEVTILHYAVYIIRSLSTLSIIFTPCYFGGWVQALKRTGAALAAHLAARKQQQHCFNTINKTSSL